MNEWIEVNKRACHENMKGKIFDYKLMKKESAAHNFPGNKGYIHNSLWHRWNCFFLALVYHTSSQCLENHSKMFKMFFVYIWRAMSTKGWRRGTPQHIAARTAQPSKQKIENFHEKKSQIPKVGFFRLIAIFVLILLRNQMNFTRKIVKFQKSEFSVKSQCLFWFH